MGISITNDEIYKLLRDSYEINPEVRDYVRKARLAGYKTCICTNNFVTRIRKLDRKFSFLADFDVQVFSYEVGVMKPDKAIFEELVVAAGVKAREIVYSDDDGGKLQGAVELGINAFVYENFNQFIDKLVSLGVKVYTRRALFCFANR